MKTSHIKVGAGAFLLAGLSLQLNAASLFTSGHGDIGVGFDEDTLQFDPHWHMGDGAVIDDTALEDHEEYAAGDLVAIVSATRLSPTGLTAGIGVADGTEIFVAGSSTYQPNLGFGTEELAEGDWAGSITLTLTGWTMPSATADFALYTTNLAGTSVADIVFSTHDVDATFAANSFPMNPADHLHFQFGFTELGTYDLELTWSGIHSTHGLITTTETFRITVVPEPSSFALLGLALGLAGFHRRR